jgi:hypothetical protein
VFESESRIELVAGQRKPLWDGLPVPRDEMLLFTEKIILEPE